MLQNFFYSLSWEDSIEKKDQALVYRVLSEGSKHLKTIKISGLLFFFVVFFFMCGTLDETLKLVFNLLHADVVSAWYRVI